MRALLPRSELAARGKVRKKVAYREELSAAVPYLLALTRKIRNNGRFLGFYAR